jgi:hypothetical protein
MSLVARLLRYHAAVEAEVEYAVQLHQLTRVAAEAEAAALPDLAAQARALVAATEACANLRREAARRLSSELDRYD